MNQTYPINPGSDILPNLVFTLQKSELGIETPEPHENTLKNRMFTTSFQQIAGGRFDPKRYAIQNKELIQSLYKTKYEYQSLNR